MPPPAAPSVGRPPASRWPLDLLPFPSVELTVDGDGRERVRRANAAADALLGGSAPGARWDALVAVDPGPPERVRPRAGGGWLEARRSAATGADDGGAVLVQLAVAPSRAASALELAASARDLQNIIDNSAALIYVKDLEGRYLLVNRHFERRFGVAGDRVVGRRDHELFPPAVADAYVEHDRRVLETGDAFEVEEPVTAVGIGPVDHDPDARWLSIKFPLTDPEGGIYGLGGISTDITDRKRAEAAARAAQREAERAHAAKSEFLSRMSHELRTPLNAILGFGQLLERRPLAAEEARSVTRIVEAGRHLLSLIDEVLQISRIEAGHDDVEVEPIPACAPLQEALQLVRPLAMTRGIAIAADLHGGLLHHVLAHHQRLEQVLLNLLANAIKYNREQGAVSVSIRAADGRLRYVIADTGPGIPAEDAARLFVPFERLGAERGETPGTGLGLALSRALLEAIDGRVGLLHSAPGEGAAFFVEVPLADGPPAPRPASRPAERSARRPLGAGTILQVEDARSNAELVEGVLEGDEAVVLRTVETGAAALAEIRRARPDVVLLDLHLPDMGGIDVLRALRADPATRELPVVVLSADATPANVERLRRERITAYLTKPLDVDRLRETLRPLLGGER